MVWTPKHSSARGMSLLKCVVKQSVKNYICSISRRSCTSHMQEIRQELQRHHGGSVDLTKDEKTGIGVITLNSPGKKNALSGSMLVALADHVTQLSQWETGKGVILRGADDTFCSGSDLATVRELLGPSGGNRMAVFMHDTLTRLHALPLVSLALLQGAALGGGAELATACDLRAMTPGAKVGFVQVKMGVTTGFGGGTRLVRLVGRVRGLDLLCTGRLLDAEEALTLGFAQHLLTGSSSALDQASALMCETYCAGAAPLIRAVKTVVTVADDGGRTLKESLQAEREVLGSVWGGELHKAALAQNVKHFAR